MFDYSTYVARRCCSRVSSMLVPMPVLEPVVAECCQMPEVRLDSIEEGGFQFSL